LDIAGTISGFTSQFGALLPLAGMMLLLWFMIIRPQKKEQKRVAEMQSKLKRGDKIVTIGGIYGVITDMSDTTVTLKIAEKVDIEIIRTAVAKPQPKKNAE
jgi:preprotein translocase subunit YajC